ncbi:DUF924 family protein [Methylocystis bryophila]|uniref:DUF924 domain-containing protein n=1 Tax=Methylocystis bryophila TaxID=655015 RepID=A0A1W6MT50_9HYPH|nr:DUF924 family protein [Methylocystis bryophila]ARN80747.1 hypothetical protein B1812_06295 [Methylocystis bryophila]BDV40822.1 membrane protein [Methylocystis bryophila]
MDSNPLVREVLDFWFGSADSAELGSRRQIWFAATPGFDQEIRQRFSEANRLAATGALDDLKQTQMGTLALIILLDQFSRNIFRGAAGAFANDSKARMLAEYAIEKRFDMNVLTVQKLFFYLPFEHAEDLELQERSVDLFVRLGDATSLQHALCHRDQIIRFGRFPDRNGALGRKSTKAEEEFLKNPFC